MTSKISFSKLLRNDLKQIRALTILQIVIYILVMPFVTMLIMASRTAENKKYHMTWEMTTVFAECVGFESVTPVLLSAAAGILIGLIVFSYLNSAEKLDLLHSLPLKREHLFAVKYAEGVLSFAAAYGCSQIITILVGVGYGIMDGRILGELAAGYLLNLLRFLVSYSCTILAVMMTGKLLTAICAIGVFGVYVPILYLLFSGLRELFLGNLFSVSDGSASRILTCSSPWLFVLFHSETMESGRKGVTGMWPKADVFFQFFAVAALLTAAAVLLYRIRKSEAAGKALAFGKTEGVIKLLLTIPAALAAAVIAHEITASLLWEILFILIFGTLGCLLMELIYRWDIRQVLGKKRHILLTFGTAAAIFCAFRFDITGQNTYLPAKEKVEAMAITDGYMNFHYEFETESGTSWRWGVSKELLDYLETGNWEPIYEVAKNGVGNSELEYYDDVSYVHLKFRLKDGREVYRHYWVNTELYLTCMDQILADQEYLERYYPIFLQDEQKECTEIRVCVQKSWLDPQRELEEYEDAYEWFVVPTNRIAELTEAYKEDLKVLKYEDVLWNSGSLEICFKDGYFNRYEFGTEFVNTLEVLKDIKEE